MYEPIKKGELLVLSRVPGFEDELHGIELRLKPSGHATHVHSWLVSGAGRVSEKKKHVFNPSVMRRISSLVEGLPPQGPARRTIDDFASWGLEFWSGGEIRTLRVHDVFIEARWQHFEKFYGTDPYPGLQQLRALWALLNFPFKWGP
jgi:hypothetical protein